MIVNEHMEQGSEDWCAIRRGRPTASRFKDIVTPKTGAYSKSSRSYMIELIAESFVPDFQSFTGNAFTERGLELESEARESFERESGLLVKEVGFCTQDNEIVGCSPDGLIEDMGEFVSGLEIKCPIPKTHVKYLLEDCLPSEYKAQVHGGMAVTGLNEWHFYSYFPGMQSLHLVVKRDEYTEKLEEALNKFIVEYRDMRSVLIPQIQIEEAA